MFRFAASTLWIPLVSMFAVAPALANDLPWDQAPDLARVPVQRVASWLSMESIGSQPEAASAPAMGLTHRAALSPDIPGVTYPRTAPPDLIADVAEPEVDFPDAIAMGTAAVGGEPPPPVTVTTLKLDVDLTTQRLIVTEHGEVKHAWPISSGRAGYATRPGTFRPRWASRMWYSRQYDMAPMPHAVFFNGGIAFHATNATHLLGRPASHGCVRLSPQNARLLYAMIHRHGYQATEITVAGNSSVASNNPGRAGGDKRRSGNGRVSASPSPAGGFLWGLF